MKRHKLHGPEARFTTIRANVSTKSGTRYWQIRCAECGNEVEVNVNIRRAMPPSIIVKKFHQAGWRVGNLPKYDLCPECQRKPIQSHVSLAAKAIQGIAAPVVHNNGGALHFDELVAIAKTLDPDHIKQLVKTVKANLPAKPAPKPKAKVVPPEESDEEYQRWLSEDGK